MDLLHFLGVPLASVGEPSGFRVNEVKKEKVKKITGQLKLRPILLHYIENPTEFEKDLPLDWYAKALSAVKAKAKLPSYLQPTRYTETGW